MDDSRIILILLSAAVNTMVFVLISAVVNVIMTIMLITVTGIVINIHNIDTLISTENQC
jgi:hypothetical protein